MNNFKFSTRSKNNLSVIHPDLIRVAELALELTPRDFIITEGLRTVERQRQLMREGKSKTMNSAHISGHALDMVPCSPVSWNRKDFESVVDAFKRAADHLGILIECGHDWASFPDSPHIQLHSKEYGY